MSQFLMGLDLGQAQDYTALTVLEQFEPGPTSRYDVRHLERFKLGTKYPDIVREVARRLAAAPLAGNCTLVIDATGVGRPVLDMLKAAHTHPVGVTITGGDKATYDAGLWRCPKRELVSVMQVLLQNGRIKFAKDLPEAATLVRELRSFQFKIDPITAHDSYGAWREGAHDDLVLAVAVAAWYGERPECQPVRTLPNIFSPYVDAEEWFAAQQAHSQTRLPTVVMTTKGTYRELTDENGEVPLEAQEFFKKVGAEV